MSRHHVDTYEHLDPDNFTAEYIVDMNSTEFPPETPRCSRCGKLALSPRVIDIPKYTKRTRKRYVVCFMCRRQHPFNLRSMRQIEEGSEPLLDRHTYPTIPCPCTHNGCTAMVPMDRIEAHLANDCPYATFFYDRSMEKLNREELYSCIQNDPSEEHYDLDTAHPDTADHMTHQELVPVPRPHESTNPDMHTLDDGPPLTAGPEDPGMAGINLDDGFTYPMPHSTSQTYLIPGDKAPEVAPPDSLQLGSLNNPNCLARINAASALPLEAVPSFRGSQAPYDGDMGRPRTTRPQMYLRSPPPPFSGNKQLGPATQPVIGRREPTMDRNSVCRSLQPDGMRRGSPSAVRKCRPQLNARWGKRQKNRDGCVPRLTGSSRPSDARTQKRLRALVSPQPELSVPLPPPIPGYTGQHSPDAMVPQNRPAPYKGVCSTAQHMDPDMNPQTSSHRSATGPSKTDTEWHRRAATDDSPSVLRHRLALSRINLSHVDVYKPHSHSRPTAKSCHVWYKGQAQVALDLMVDYGSVEEGSYTCKQIHDSFKNPANRFTTQCNKHLLKYGIRGDFYFESNEAFIRHFSGKGLPYFLTVMVSRLMQEIHCLCPDILERRDHPLWARCIRCRDFICSREVEVLLARGNHAELFHAFMTHGFFNPNHIHRCHKDY
eukprot:gnl/Dysnectes_brevis/3321_a4170_949.p1 GENE.gnl/Dysnectes_brevis/3321_a4170_949~~gnl/Dysnectes_brevis/3321_a4170_949.p1  ORF type:complete len:658 (-),score=87.50 gnl/Dysnectes_brevis/3321_a4170_949:192-2165(-)